MESATDAQEENNAAPGTRPAWMGVQQIRPVEDPIGLDEIPELLLKVAKLDGSVIRSKFSIQAIRDALVRLPTEERLRALGIVYDSEIQLASLGDEAEALYLSAQEDWFREERYQVYPRSGGVPSPRARGDGHLGTDAILGIGPYYVDVGFRSSDYPELEYILGLMAEEKARLRLELDRILSRNGLEPTSGH